MVLFINCCVRKESRTLTITKELLKRFDNVKEIKLFEIDFPKVNEEFIERRNNLINNGNFNDSMFDLAKEFSQAKEIVIAAPYWDFSFPASLKQYIEQINVIGITFKYNADGIPQGLCKANKLYYVTTSGGNYAPDEYGFGYIKELAQSFYGIKDVVKIEANGLDIDGANPELIINETIDKLNNK